MGDYTIFIAVYFSVLGLLLGSFVNAWVWRVHTKRKISRGRSMCPDCKHELAWYDLVPVFSFLSLGGKCRYCHKTISPRYPTIELITAALFGALNLTFQPTTVLGWLAFVVLLAVTVLLMAAASYDSLHSLLPDAYIIPAGILSIIYALLRQISTGEMVWQKIIGTVVIGIFFWALWFFSGGQAMGDGDIGLAVVMGLLLTPWQLGVGFIAAFNSGAIVGVALILMGRKKRTDHIPFGPFLIFGIYFALLFADKLHIF